MKFVWLILIGLLALAGCSTESANPLEGCFAKKVYGEPIIKVTAGANKHFMTVNKNGKWSESYGLHPGTSEKLIKLFGDSASHVRSSLIADKGSLAIFNVDPVAMDKKSEFYAILLLVAGDVYKVDCD